MSQPGYLGDPYPTLNPKRGAHNPSQIFHHKLWQTVPDTTVVCTDNLWNHTIVLSNSAIVDPLGAPLPQNGIVKKLNSKLLQNRNRYLTALYTRPVETH